MKKMILHIFLLCAFGHECSGGWFDCEDYWTDGMYCTQNLTGYHMCTWKGGWEGRYQHTTVPCPKGTRCTCHYRNKCSVKEKDICKPFSTPKPFIDPAIFTYTGRRLYDYISPQYKDEITQLEGEIRQDMKNGKVFTIRKRTSKGKWKMENGQPKWENGKPETYFNLIVPESNGGWMTYDGEMESKKCRVWRYSASDLPYIKERFLGYDINRYTLLKSWKNEASNATHEKWYFKRGDYEGQYFDRFWEVEVKNGLSFPVKFTENFLESEDNTHNTYEDFYYNITLPELGADTNKWFEVPEFC